MNILDYDKAKAADTDMRTKTLQFADLPFDEIPFDENGCNKWEKSSIRRNMNSIAFKAYNRRIDHPNSVFDWLSRDEEVVSLYQSDEKCNFIFTASAFRDLFILCARANSNATFRRTPSDLPLFFLAGDRDPVGRYGDGVRRVISLYRAGGSRNIAAVFFKNARHELLNELGRNEPYGDNSRWLEERLAEQTETAPAETQKA